MPDGRSVKVNGNGSVEDVKRAKKERLLVKSARLIKSLDDKESQELFTRWQRHMQAQSTSAGTPTQMQTVYNYLGWTVVPVREIGKPLLAITDQDMESYWVDLEQFNKTSPLAYKKGMKRLFLWLARKVEGKLEYYEGLADGIGKVGTPVRQLGDSDILTKEQVYILIDTAPTSREKAMLAFMWDSGCRPEDEIPPLKIDDLKFLSQKYATLKIRWTKRGINQQRDVLLKESVPYLRVWIADNKTPWLFPSESRRNYGGMLGEKGITGMFRRIVVKAIKENPGKLPTLPQHKRTRNGNGKNQGITPYIFRHSRISEWLKRSGNATIPIATVAAQAGTSILQIQRTYFHAEQAEHHRNLMVSEGDLPEDAEGETFQPEFLVCPNCKLEVPKDVPFCGCGYVLDEQLRKQQVPTKPDMELIKEAIKEQMAELLESAGKPIDFINVQSHAPPQEGETEEEFNARVERDKEITGVPVKGGVGIRADIVVEKPKKKVD